MNKSNLIRRAISAKISAFLAEAESFERMSHGGLKGRFREIVLANLLSPLLPSTCVCVHGTTVDADGVTYPERGGRREGDVQVTEDDILIVDRDLIPACFVGEYDAIVPMESVLMRIEVKTKITASELDAILIAAKKYRALKYATPPGEYVVKGGESIQLIFAFRTDLTEKSEIQRLLEKFTEHKADLEDPPIKGICVVGKGFWLFKEEQQWQFINADDEHNEILAFLGVVCNTIPTARWMRKFYNTRAVDGDKRLELKQGTNFDRLGTYLIDTDDLKRCVNSNPAR